MHTEFKVERTVERTVECLLTDQVVGEVYQDLEEAESSWRELISDSAVQPTVKTMQEQWDAPL